MTLDGLTLGVCIKELQETLSGAKVERVLMPKKEEVVLQLYTKEGNVRLLISSDAGDCSMYLTKVQRQNPKSPPVFCMFLRKHLTGARITEIRQMGLNRVVHIDFDAKDELLHPVKLSLIIEIMGKYSNVILVNGEGKILDSIKKISMDVSSLRQILPGVPYAPPPQKKYDPLQASVTTIAELLMTKRQTQLASHLVATFDGMSTQTAMEILHRANIAADEFTGDMSENKAERIASEIKAFFTEALSGPAPCLQRNADGLPVFFSALPYETYPESTRQSFHSCNEMLDYYYSKRADYFKIRQQKEHLAKTVSKLLSKLEKKINIYTGSISDAKKAEKIKMRADHITANLYRLKKGMQSFEAYDYETGEPLQIELDLSQTPGDLAQKLYKKVAKLKKGAELNSKKLEDALFEQEFLLGTLHFIETAQHSEDIADIKHTLVKAGYAEPSKKGKKETPGEESAPLEFASPTGYKILVGKNDRQNDILTMRTASKDDIWFHTQKIPGSHVLLITNGKTLDEIDDETVVYAASLAAHYSRAKQSGKTPVDYTQRRNIKKPPAARPGKVIYDDYFTVYVDGTTL